LQKSNVWSWVVSSVRPRNKRRTSDTTYAKRRPATLPGEETYTCCSESHEHAGVKVMSIRKRIS
jgi:hypothetical protein